MLVLYFERRHRLLARLRNAIALAAGEHERDAPPTQLGRGIDVLDAPDRALAIEHVEVGTTPRPGWRKTLARRRVSFMDERSLSGRSDHTCRYLAIPPLPTLRSDPHGQTLWRVLAGRPEAASNGRAA